jgi:hypothetical protein
MRCPTTSRKRIFVGPTEIAGFYRNLTLGLRALGVNCDYVTYNGHVFGYGGETVHSSLLKLVKWFNQFRGKPHRGIIMRAIFAIPPELLAFAYFVTTLFRYDVFIFGACNSLLRANLDLPLLRLFRKVVIMNMMHGSDMRPPYIDGSYQSRDGTCLPTPKFLASTAAQKTQRIRYIERYASYVVGAPFSSSQFSTRRLINVLALGLPCQFEWILSSGIGEKSTGTGMDRVDREAVQTQRPVRILHAPSHPSAKGSPLIEQAISNLKAKGHQIEFVLLKDVPNREVLQEIEQCNFIVDQVYSDGQMAGLSAEAAWFGKPAVVGGYGFDYLKRFFVEGMMPPSKTCHPDDIEAAIAELIVNKDRCEQLGRRAQEFVHTKWSAERVAERFLRIVDGDIPADWWFDPESVVYLRGAGQSEDQTKKNIRQLVAAYGVGALQLSHRPALEKAFLQFAGIECQ